MNAARLLALSCVVAPAAAQLAALSGPPRASLSAKITFPVAVEANLADGSSARTTFESDLKVAVAGAFKVRPIPITRPAVSPFAAPLAEKKKKKKRPPATAKPKTTAVAAAEVVEKEEEVAAPTAAALEAEAAAAAAAVAVAAEATAAAAVAAETAAAPMEEDQP